MKIRPAFEYADSAFLFIQHCCIFVLFCILADCPSRFFFFFFFCEICGRNGNDMPRKRKKCHEKVGSIGQKNDGDAHPYGFHALTHRMLASSAHLATWSGKQEPIIPAIFDQSAGGGSFGESVLESRNKILVRRRSGSEADTTSREGLRKICWGAVCLASRGSTGRSHAVLATTACRCGGLQQSRRQNKCWPGTQATAGRWPA